MTDRDRNTRGADWVDTTAGDQDSNSGDAEGTGSLGAPPTDVGRRDLPDTDPGAGGAGVEQSDLGGVDVGAVASQAPVSVRPEAVVSARAQAACSDWQFIPESGKTFADAGSGTRH